ncbi:MAG TPA: family 16 glycosylhydrolase [Spirochaetota bacterium]|nr:family 16 glycosylhydrolase [Spirochaetota bacterium]
MKKLLSVLFLAVVLIACSSKDDEVKFYYGAEVFSHKPVLFGKFEVRAKLINESGVVSSFFLYDNASWQGRPFPWREIDIESIGKEKGMLQTNIITGFADKRVTSEGETVIENVGTEYKTYTIEWTPDYVAWFVDGKEIRRDTAESSQQVVDLRDTPQTYRMNVWIAIWDEWVGKFKESSFPMYQSINWIKYYEYTPEKSEKFTHKWTDDFDTFDESRWGKGDWSFEGNLVVFVKGNAEIKDGHLVLGLTKDEFGYSGEFLKDE